MRDCIVLGSGRSGTSMVAGALSSAGYFMGEALYAPRPSNPKGLFESPEINTINDVLLTTAVRRRSPWMPRFVRSQHPGPGQSWLARLPPGRKVQVPPDIAVRMDRACARRPFCYKDPRFSYTLPAWRPHLRDAVCLCVFRDPAVTAASILKECRDQRYLWSLRIDVDTALDVWRFMYIHILRDHCSQGVWVFVHYDQVLDGSAARRIEVATGAPVDRSFSDPRMSHATAQTAVPTAIRELYLELCDKAGYRPPSLGPKGGEG